VPAVVEVSDGNIVEACKVVPIVAASEAASKQEFLRNFA
jgi:hypothetical protein